MNNKIIVPKIHNIMFADDFFTYAKDFVPKNINDFNLLIEIEIAFNDTFLLYNTRVTNKCNCNEKVFKYDDVVFCKGCIRMKKYNFEVLKNSINEYLYNCRNENIENVLSCLSKVFYSEYE